MFGLKFMMLMVEDDGAGAGGSGSEEFYEYKGANGTFKLPIGFKDEMSKRLSIKETEVQKAFEAKFQEFQKKHEDTVAELEKIKKSTMSEKELKDMELQEREKLLRQKEQEAETNWSLFSEDRIKNTILNELSGYDVINPRQVEILFRNLYEVKLAKDKDTFKVIVKAGENSMTVADSIKEFLSDPVNSNLLRSTLRPGGNTTRSRTQHTEGQTKFTREDMKTTEGKKRFNELIKQGIVPEII